MFSLFSLDQFKGVAERAVYGLVLMVCMKLVAKGYMDADMAAYTAAGAMTLVGGVYSWIRNRPSSLLDRAANSIAEDNHIVVTPTAHASVEAKAEARQLASDTGAKVTAKAT